MQPQTHKFVGSRVGCTSFSRGALPRSRTGAYRLQYGRAATSTLRPKLVHLRVFASDPAASDASTSTSRPTTVPGGPEETVDQVVTAVRKAWQDGVKRQQVEFLLPIIGATELDDWPGGIRQQFKAASPMVEAILAELKKEEGLTGRLTPSIWDAGDAVGAWEGENLCCVLFPTAEVLRDVRRVAESCKGLVLLVKPQWQDGQVVSDFGFGPWKARNEELVGSFEATYTLKQLRALGEEVRVLRSYPGAWQVHVAEQDGQLPLVFKGDKVPSYPELEKLLRARPGSNASMTWAQRLQREIEFNMKQ